MSGAASKIEFANTLRGAAAVLVMFGHYCTTFWIYRDVASSLINSTGLPAEIVTPLYLRVLDVDPFVFGLYGVGLFFVISGFVIPFSFARTDWRGFVVGRVLRIYPTYWVGLTISIMVIVCMGALAGKAFPYSAGVVIMNYLPGLRDVAWVPGIDGIIWTLDVEIKFYVVCALSATLLRSGRITVFLVPVSLSIPAVLAGPSLASMQQVGSSYYGYLSTYCTTVQFLDLMFIGVAFNFFYRRLISPALFLASVIVLATSMCAVWMASSTLPKVLLATYGAAVLTFGAVFAFPNLLKSRSVTDFFAAISYPLYVVHAVLGYAILRLTVGSGIPPWLAIVIASTTSIAVATVVHFAIEVPSHIAGRLWANRFRRLDAVSNQSRTSAGQSTP